MPILTNKFDAFGLDIGDRSIKAAHITKNSANFCLKSFGATIVPADVLNKGVISNTKELSNIINNLLKSCLPKPIQTKYVHACLPETHTFIKMLTIKKIDEKEIAAHIRDILPNHIPLATDESYIDWQIIESGTPPQSPPYQGGEAEGVLNVLVGAVPKAIADGYTEMLLNANLIPVSLQIEAEAILRALKPENNGKTDTECFAIVDIGATRSSFILVDKGTIQFAVSLPTAGAEITQIIAQKLNISIQEAEKAKKMFGLDKKKCDGSVASILDQEISELAQNIQKNSNFYIEHFKDAKPISYIILCGGGANLINLKESLKQKLPNLTIQFGYPIINFEKTTEEMQDYSLSFTTAIGLGLTNV